ncbi:Predicted dehydrogenase [Actinopolymorpha cephalotaxi]|uniref:Dehydrogenase n=1 Tax=Actinopolymorpha cephalotaxi TaxID=504797 RepID=A0A1I3AYP9_9ACTN|nr:Gfo/Idh/MocA family oxidoreductase [Actinopolymorpha cephalotaxi]NYH84289.1 putative dehydrogenase [Actinopolymorpha cephalotaxi]SFH55092.1 Predicted dehydrogenase [Actinopolymorpha cephalotaxi]
MTGRRTELVRVAVVGAGGWGAQHARIFAGRSDTELVGVLGRSPERTTARAKEYDTTPYTDLGRLLEEAGPDLVSVCLPNEDHFEVTLRLLRAGANLLVEKPLVFDLDEADRLLAAAADSGSFFAINFNHRYAEPFLRARAAIDAGELGRLTFLTWRFGGEANHGRSPHANLIETQCHGFDLLEHLGGPIKSVMAQMGNATYGAFSTVAIALTFTSGAVGTLLGSYDSSYAYPGTQQVEVNGTLGRAVVDDTVRRFTLSRAGEETRTVWEAGYFNDEARSFHATFDRHVAELLAAFREGAPPPVPATAGRRALQLAQAAISSYESGRRVPTPMPSRGD